MRFDSQDNLQVSGVRLGHDGVLYFRCYGKSEVNQTITDKTYIIRGVDGSYELLREIDEEVTSIEVLADGTFVAIGCYGNVYEYRDGGWTDRALAVSPPRMLSRSIVHDGAVYAVGRGKRFLKLTTSGWIPVCRMDEEDGKTHLYGVCPGDRGNFVVCGRKGFLAEVGESGIQPLDVPTNCLLTNVARQAEGSTVVAGNRGTFFVGQGDQWADHSQPDLEVDFTSVTAWKGGVYISANSSVLHFADGTFSTAGAVQSFDVIGLDDSLWSIGINTLNRFDGVHWTEVRITL